jgi:hypothetical protein
MGKALTQTSEQRLSGSRNSDYTNRNSKVLDRIAQKRADHGYYLTPTAAIEALTGGCVEGVVEWSGLSIMAYP